MIKIKTLYKLEKQGKGVKAIDEITDGSEWVIKGEGRPYLKLDGTACAIINGEFYKRLQVRNSEIANKLIENKGYILCDRDSGDKYYGWIPVQDLYLPEDYWHRKGWDNLSANERIDGTYELIGKNVQSNVYSLDDTFLINHKELLPHITYEIPREFNALKEFLYGSLTPELIPPKYQYIFQDNRSMFEGIIWRHEDGRMVKIRRSDFY